MSTRRLAISYSRFSDPKQARGDSEDRQEKDFRNFCRRHNLTPLSEVYADRGRSGYRDEHRKKGRLGQLIAAAKDGRFEAGTVIVVEAWDRLGRLRPDKQTDLLAELLRTGVNIGVCRLDDIFTEEDFGTHKWAGLSLFVMLAYQESKQKAERVASSWQKRRERARDDGRVMSARLPGWLRLVHGQIVPIPERVAAIKRIFQLSAEGYGKRRIIVTLREEGIPPFGAGNPSPLPDRWTMPYVAKILNDRRVLGELQPRKNDGSADGPLLLGYFPRVVSDEEYALARAGQNGRRGRGGSRDRKYVNVFRSLLVSALDGEGFFLSNRGTEEEPKLILRNNAGLGGRQANQTFPYGVFEEAILGQLKEAQDAMPAPREKPAAADVLRAKLASVRLDLAGLQAELREGYSRALAAVLREKEVEEERIAGQLHDELARSMRPMERAMRELPSLVDQVRKKGDEARLRIRPVLQSIVQEMRVLLVRRHSWGITAVQVFFHGDAVRNYLLAYQSAGHNRKGGWWCRSFADTALPGDLDLRKRADAHKLLKALEAVDVKKMEK
jgi:DNA invertase Pin-like site-specific DNA recombinase